MVFLFISIFIKVKIPVYVQEKVCQPLRQLQPEKGESLKIFKLLIKLYFSCFLFCGFTFYINNCIKGEIFVCVIGNICRPLSQIWPETGGFLAKIPNH